MDNNIPSCYGQRIRDIPTTIFENSHDIGGLPYTPRLIRNYCLMFATALDRETKSFKFMTQCSRSLLIILITSHTEVLQSSNISQEAQPQLLSLIFLEHPLLLLFIN